MTNMKQVDCPNTNLVCRIAPLVELYRAVVSADEYASTTETLPQYIAIYRMCLYNISSRTFFKIYPVYI